MTEETAFPNLDPLLRQAHQSILAFQYAEARESFSLFDSQEAKPSTYNHICRRLLEAQLERSAGRPRSAEEILRALLDDMSTHLAPELTNDLSLLRVGVQDELGTVLMNQGKFPESEALLRHTLELSIALRGETDPGCTESMNSLALVLLSQGKYAEAEALLHRSLAILEEALGADHFACAEPLHTLGLVLSDQRRYAEVQGVLRRALAIKEKALGPDHPALCVTLSNLAGNLLTLGMAATAEPLVKRALVIAEHEFGPHDQEVGQILAQLTGIQAALGDRAVRTTAERAERVLRQNFGSDHPMSKQMRAFLKQL